jgi:hypothetical protein
MDCMLEMLMGEIQETSGKMDANILSRIKRNGEKAEYVLKLRNVRGLGQVNGSRLNQLMLMIGIMCLIMCAVQAFTA